MSEGKQIYYHNLRENLRKMNPRFKELAIQAGAYVDGDTILTGPMDVAKFAELIVRECEKVAKAGTWYYDSPSCGWRNPINHVCNVMKEYFGVEE